MDVERLLRAPAVVQVIDRSADAVAARAGLRRVLEAHRTRAEAIVDDARLLAAVVAIACASRSLTQAIVGDDGALAAAGDTLAVDVAPDDEIALRVWKRRELVRIAARDLLGLADLREVGGALARVARESLGAAAAIAAPDVPLAVIGMGKLGGRELNYASDVDVLFVHDGASAAAEHAARAVLRVMTAPTADGIVFRTDAALRPEGRSGPLSRSLDSYRAYWERWAQTWERQALIKAAAVAGDDALGAQFVEQSEAFVWSPELEPDAVRAVRTMKAASEAQVSSRAPDELKRGAGGIRDIEFTVQLLQLVHGRADATVRSATTLDALEALAAGGYVAIDDARVLDEAYSWLRTVEHRLQLVDEQQTHTVPSSIEARTRLARVLGHRDRGTQSALEQFESELVAQRARVRAIHERMFFAPVLDALAGRGALAPAAAFERLAALGFTDATQTRAALAELTSGLTRQSRLMQQLLPLLLDWLAVTPDPDLGLLQLRRLAEGQTRSARLARTVRDSPVAAARACRLLGSSRVLGGALYHQPEFLDTLASDAELSPARDHATLVAAAVATLDWREDDEGRRAALRRFKRRELLRVGARDVLGVADAATIEHELSALADACVDATLRSLEPTVPFAVIGMGRYGGAELSYASDLDVLFVHGGTTRDDAAAADALARALRHAIAWTTAEGKAWDVDADLRPEGAAGALVRSLDAYRVYYERWVQTWERQALLRARFVAGDAELGARFLALVEPFVYRDPFPETDERDVRVMKARIEHERVRPGDDAQFHLKLGRGTMSDVEWTVQLLQLRHGARHPAVRTPSTRDGLARLERAALIDADDADALGAAYDFADRARGYRYLLAATPGDSLPVDRADATRLGRMLGYHEHPATALREEYRRLTRRARAVVERVFYGRDEG